MKSKETKYLEARERNIRTAAKRVNIELHEHPSYPIDRLLTTVKFKLGIRANDHEHDKFLLSLIVKAKEVE